MSTRSRAPKQTQGKRGPHSKRPGVVEGDRGTTRGVAHSEPKKQHHEQRQQSTDPVVRQPGRINMTICDCRLTDTDNRRVLAA
jgi:hypothetical protein